jgi:hypothetical protein
MEALTKSIKVTEIALWQTKQHILIGTLTADGGAQAPGGTYVLEDGVYQVLMQFSGQDFRSGAKRDDVIMVAVVAKIERAHQTHATSRNAMLDNMAMYSEFAAEARTLNDHTSHPRYAVEERHQSIDLEQAKANDPKPKQLIHLPKQ